MEEKLTAILAEYDEEQLRTNFDSFNALYGLASVVSPRTPSTSSKLHPDPDPDLHSTNGTKPNAQPHPAATTKRFKVLKTDEEVEEAKKKSIPKNTEKSTTWSVNVWKEWSAHRRQTCTSYTDWPTHLLIAQPIELDYWLCKFVLETKKSNGEHYPPDTLYAICNGLLRFIRETRPEINIFKDPVFCGFQRTLDSEMKRLRTLGLGVKRKQAEPITVEEENMLWEKGFLGDSNPKSLLDTMLYLCGVHFALRSGEEHRSLRLSQFELIQPKHGSTTGSFIYTENYSKNNQGGLLHRKVQPKCVTCYANDSDPNRCLVRLFQTYLRHRPADNQNFYLTPLQKPKGDIWYTNMPVGHNTLSRIVTKLCNKAGIPGYKTNHSLRVTSATRLFQSGIDEQLIMSHTGHRSVDGVRSYKRVSNEQKKAVSSALQTAQSIITQPNTARETIGSPSTKRPKLDVDNSTMSCIPKSSQAPSVFTTENNTSLSLTKCSSCTPSFSFSGCSSITINYQN